MTAHAQRYLDYCHNRRKPQLIIDTDPGQDDAAAILMALGLEKMGLLEVLALTTVAGNVTLHNTSKNACVIADWAGRSDLGVYGGAEKPLIKPLINAQHVHGNNGLGGMQLHKPKTPLQALHAVAYMVDLLTHAEPYSITICAVGPLTNIAHMLSLAPEASRGIKEIVIMGGSYFHPGNVTPMAEFTFYVDPHAAQVVLQAGVPLRILPLDVTHQALLTRERIQSLAAIKNENGPRLATLLDHYERHEQASLHEGGAPLHDPCAIACALIPELFEQKRVHVAVETQGQLTMGACVVDWWNKSKAIPNANWATAVDDEAFFDLFNTAIAALP